MIKSFSKIILIFSILFLFGFSKSFAGTGDNVTGWAWSSNIGWISFNCVTDSSCDAGTLFDDPGADGTLEGPGGDTIPGTEDTGGTDAGTGFIENSWRMLVNKTIESFDTAFVSPTYKIYKKLSYLIKDTLSPETIYADDLDGISPPGVDYGVNIDPLTGSMSGYAWSENIGWISFNESSGCPGEGICSPSMDLGTGALKGWAKAINGNTSDDGWDGWISLSCKNHDLVICFPSYKVKFDLGTGATSGTDRWAWGSDVIGWVYFGDVVVDLPQPTLSLVATPNIVSAGGSTSLSWTSTSTTSCSASSSDALWTGTKPTNSIAPESVIPSGDIVLTDEFGDIHYYTKYVMDCDTTTGEPISSEEYVEVIYEDGVSAGSLVLQASPTIASGDNGYKVKLTWYSPTATTLTSCVANSYSIATGTDVPLTGTGWTGPQTSLTATNSYTASTPGETIFVPENPTKYSITCEDVLASESVTATTVVPRVLAVPSVDIFASSPSGTPGSYNVDLSWEPLNVTSCTASNEDGISGWSGPKSALPGLNTQSDVSLSDGGTTYTITCSGAYGSASDSVTVFPPSDPGDDGDTSCTDCFPADGPAVALTYADFIPGVLVPGSVTLIWKTQDVVSCEASSTDTLWTGPKAATPDGIYTEVGVLYTSPFEDYTITCIGDDDSTVSDTLKLNDSSPKNPIVRPTWIEF